VQHDGRTFGYRSRQPRASLAATTHRQRFRTPYPAQQRKISLFFSTCSQRRNDRGRPHLCPHAVATPARARGRLTCVTSIGRHYAENLGRVIPSALLRPNESEAIAMPITFLALLVGCGLLGACGPTPRSTTTPCDHAESACEESTNALASAIGPIEPSAGSPARRHRSAQAAGVRRRRCSVTSAGQFKRASTMQVPAPADVYPTIC